MNSCCAHTHTHPQHADDDDDGITELNPSSFSSYTRQMDEMMLHDVLYYM
jgi:hypothetical protein